MSKLGAALVGLVAVLFLFSFGYAKEIPEPTEPIGKIQNKLTDRSISTTVDARKFDLCLARWSTENAKCKKAYRECLKNIPAVDPACTDACAMAQDKINDELETFCMFSMLLCSSSASSTYDICLLSQISQKLSE